MEKDPFCGQEIQRTTIVVTIFGILIFLLGMTSVALSDVRPIISVSPMSVNSGSVRVGSSSVQRTVTIKNTGNEDLHISLITISDQSQFSQTNTCSTIPAKSSCPVTVTFTPMLPFGKKSAIMSISSDDIEKPAMNVKLSGQAPPPKISVSPMSVNSGSLPVGGVSLNKIVTVKNTGLSDLEINSINITGTDASEFIQTNDCTTAIPKGSSCTFNVKLSPMLPFGNKSAIMSISSNDPKKPIINVKLSGEAPPPKISVSPTSVNFGSFPAGSLPLPKMLRIMNTGISDLKIDSINITDTDNEFNQTNDCSLLEKGDECTINVTFSPNSTGHMTAIMSILSNDPKNSVRNINLFGTVKGSVATQSIAGLWMGGFSSNIFHRTYNVIGIITESDLARFAAPSASTQYSGVVHVSGNNFSSSAEAYGSASIYIGIVKITGTFTPGGTMNGTYSGVGDKGTFSLAYNSLYERPSSLIKIAGNWTDYSSGYYQTVTIDSNGHVIGEDFGGCTYSGNVGLINSLYNAYNANLTIRNCGSKDGFYNGLAALTDTDSNNDTILAIVSNSTYSFIIELRR